MMCARNYFWIFFPSSFNIHVDNSSLKLHSQIQQEVESAALEAWQQISKILSNKSYKERLHREMGFCVLYVVSIFFNFFTQTLPTKWICDI